MLAALAIVWVFTALGGITMFSIWLSRGGHRQRELAYEPNRVVTAEERRAEARARGGESSIGLSLIGSHGAMGIMGVILAIVYAVVGSEPGWEEAPWFLLAWAVVLAGLGLKMFTGGSPDRRQAAAESPVPLAEEGWPKPVIYAHGLGALGVLTLTFLVAVGIGR